MLTQLVKVWRGRYYQLPALNFYCYFHKRTVSLLILFSTLPSNFKCLFQNASRNNNIMKLNAFCVLKEITYWVGYNSNKSFRAHLSTGLSKVTNNGSISIEEVITSHAWLPWHSSRNNYNFCSFQSILKNERNIGNMRITV